MKNINVYIFGTGGFAAEVTEYIRNNNSHSVEQNINIIGYFDINDNNYQKYKFTAPFLGDERLFEFPKHSKAILAIGEHKIRDQILSHFENNNTLEFINFIHHTCLISSSTKLGKGNILCPYVIIGPNAIVGDHNIFNYYVALPHDCELGNNNIFSPNVNITGFTKIGNHNFFGTSCTTLPSISIGNNNKLQAGITLNKKISDNNIVFSINSIKTMPIYK